MENEIESDALPPVSSLRSRFEALSRGGTNDHDGSDQSRTSKSAVSAKINVICFFIVAAEANAAWLMHKIRQAIQSPRVASPAATPTVVVYPAKPSEAQLTNLRRVVSTPTSQPTSPTLSSRPGSGHGEQSMNPIMVNADEEDSSTPNSATPRRTPSTPNFGTAGRGFPTGLGLGMPSGDSVAKGPSRSASDSSRVGHERSNSATSGLTDKAITDIEHFSRKLTKRPPPPPPGKKAYVEPHI